MTSEKGFAFPSTLLEDKEQDGGNEAIVVMGTHLSSGDSLEDEAIPTETRAMCHESNEISDRYFCLAG